MAEQKTDGDRLDAVTRAVADQIRDLCPDAGFVLIACIPGANDGDEMPVALRSNAESLPQLMALVATGMHAAAGMADDKLIVPAPGVH